MLNPATKPRRWASSHTHTDADVELVYCQISEIIKPARKKGFQVIVGGDFNAEVASAEDADVTVGKYTNPSGNVRGFTLQHWASKEHLVLSNTLFRKRWGKIWTHKQHGRERGSKSQTKYFGFRGFKTYRSGIRSPCSPPTVEDNWAETEETLAAAKTKYDWVGACRRTEV